MIDALELHPASDWCQRWAHRQHSWRHRSDGGFNPDRYTVEPIGEAAAKSFVVEHHYSGSYPAAVHRYGMFTQGRLVGVMVLGVPPQAKVLTSVFPELRPFSESLDLSRFVLLDDPCPGNSESWFIGQAFRQAAAAGVHGVVSFADPCPRRVNGRLLFPGHVGTIYCATNARYTGRATSRTLLVLPDGTVLNARSQQKVRCQERGHRHVEQKLITLGAPVMRAGENPTSWLNRALETVGATRIRHRGNHRYAFALGNKTERRRVRIALPGSAYPKEVDAA